MQKRIALYDDYFPKQCPKMSICSRTRITSGIKNFFKIQAKVIFEFLKNKNNKNEVEYKNWKKIIGVNQKLHKSKII